MSVGREGAGRFKHARIFLHDAVQNTTHCSSDSDDGRRKKTKKRPSASKGKASSSAKGRSKAGSSAALAKSKSAKVRLVELNQFCNLRLNSYGGHVHMMSTKFLGFFDPPCPHF